MPTDQLNFDASYFNHSQSQPSSWAASGPFKSASIVFVFSIVMWCVAHMLPNLSTLGLLMTRLQAAGAPQRLVGGWTRRPGRLPRVPLSAEAKSSRRDFAAEVEWNESGGRARCWAPPPPIHQRRDAAYPPWHLANRGSPCPSVGTLQLLWSGQVVKGTSTRRRWCRLELRRVV